MLYPSDTNGKDAYADRQTDSYFIVWHFRMAAVDNAYTKCFKTYDIQI